MRLLLIAGFLIVALILSAVVSAIRRHGFAVLIWRWFSGHALNGNYYTNASWFQRGDKVLHPTGRVGSWHYKPRIHRAEIRTAVTVAALYTAYGLIRARSLTITCLEILGAVSLVIGAIVTVRQLRQERNDRVIVTPLAMALSDIVSLPVSDTRKGIALPPSFATVKDGAMGIITLPPKFRATPEQRNAIEHLVSSRLPVDADYSWRTSRNPQSVAILACPKPPDTVMFADMISEMKSCRPGQVVIGIDRRKETFCGSFNTDDPHWGFSVGSGRGKSTFLLCTAAQVLHQDTDATVDGIDPKMSSLEPLIGIPGVNVACDPGNVPEMWQRVSAVKAEMMTRLDTLKRDPTAEFSIKLLVIDEVNMFGAMSAAIWKQDKDKGDSATPPVWADIASILWMGRQVRCHCIFVGQRLDDKATGGIGLRDSLGFRGLAGYRANQWMMLVGTAPVPRSQKAKGRWIYSDGQSETWVQNMIADPKDTARNAVIIRDYAMVGRTHARIVNVGQLPVRMDTVKERIG